MSDDLRGGLAALAFGAILGCVFIVVWRLAEPRQLVTEAESNRDVLETQVALDRDLLTAIAPTETAYATSTPTRTPKPATSTPQPTYGPDASPGWYMVPAWTETPFPAMTVEAVGLPQCAEVTPRPYADQPCRVEEP